jgi:hypothetical protein
MGNENEDQIRIKNILNPIEQEVDEAIYNLEREGVDVEFIQKFVSPESENSTPISSPAIKPNSLKSVFCSIENKGK